MVTFKVVQGLCSGTGFSVLLSSSRDMKILILLRMVRLFAFGGTTLILALFLADLGFSDASIGLFMTLTLVGDLLISTVLTFVGDRMGVRFTIIIGCFAMMAGGIAFAFIKNYWLLLLASVIAVINPSGNEIDPFKAIEESAIARISTSEDCTEFFAWWSLLGMLGTAGSNLATGFAIDELRSTGSWSLLDSYRAIFLGYAAIGLLKLCCCLGLSAEVEPRRTAKHDGEVEADTERPLLGETLDGYDAIENQASVASLQSAREEKRAVAMLTAASYSFMWRLCLAMALDFIGSGLAQLSWMTYFFKREFKVQEGYLGLAISIASLVSALLNLAAAPLSRLIGQVPTMIVCHTLNSMTLLTVSLSHNQGLALVLFILRIVTREIDNAPRQAFISAGVLEEERTSAMSMINAVKTVGSGLGLFLTGQFANADRFSTAFVLAGSLKLGYNLLMTIFFWKFWQSWKMQK